MQILIAPDSFKGSLRSKEVAERIALGIKKADPSCVCVLLPMADGGEGTIEALASAGYGEKLFCEVEDPLGRKITASFLYQEEEKRAVVEMAQASGLCLVDPKELDPKKASTYGTGQLLRAAIEKGAKEICIGLGGSATVDAGVGCLLALGVSFQDKKGRPLSRVGGLLSSIYSYRDARLYPDVTFTLACDVGNPLLGEHGAISVFGPQKGVKKEERASYERGMEHFAGLLRSRANPDEKGAGAAGGLGFGLSAFFNCRFESGFSFLARATRLREHLKEADFVITGEGRLDEQSLYGKLPIALCALAKEYHVPLVAFTGQIRGSYERFQDSGILAVIPIVKEPCTLDWAMQNAGDLLERAALGFMQVLLLGASLKKWEKKGE